MNAIDVLVAVVKLREGYDMLPDIASGEDFEFLEKSYKLSEKWVIPAIIKYMVSDEKEKKRLVVTINEFAREVNVILEAFMDEEEADMRKALGKIPKVDRDARVLEMLMSEKALDALWI